MKKKKEKNEKMKNIVSTSFRSCPNAISSFLFSCLCVYIYMCVCVYVCVCMCACEKEEQNERKKEKKKHFDCKFFQCLTDLGMDDEKFKKADFTLCLSLSF